MTLLCLLGLVVQSLGGGLSGAVLCIGCERTGWMIKAPETSAHAEACCGENHSDEDEQPAATASMGRRCDCYQVALSAGFPAVTVPTRIESPRELDAISDFSCSTVVLPSPERPSDACPHASLVDPPRLLLPSARRTVLVI